MQVATMDTDKFHPVDLPEWLLARVDAAIIEEVSEVGCVCVDEHRRVARVELVGSPGRAHRPRGARW